MLSKEEEVCSKGNCSEASCSMAWHGSFTPSFPTSKSHGSMHIIVSILSVVVIKSGEYLRGESIVYIFVEDSSLHLAEF